MHVPRVVATDAALVLVQLVIDVVPGRGGMFSLENGEGVRFLTRSRVFTDEEYEALKETEPPAAG